MRIARRLRDDLVLAAAGAEPREACGLLVLDDAGDVVLFLPLENVADDGAAFQIGDVDLALWVALEQRAGVELALWHSHVDAPCYPSRADIRHARPGDRLVIYSLASDELRAFRVEPHDDDRLRGRLRARELPVDVV